MKTELRGTSEADAHLSRIELRLRTKVRTRGLRAAAQVVRRRAKQLAPKPGYRGDKPGKTALRSTIAYRTRDYQGGAVGVVVIGPRRPEGSHGHLVERGHRIVTHAGVDTGRRTEAKAFLAPAADQTKAEQKAAFVGELKRLAEEAR